MAEKPPSEVMSALPRTRPHRRSAKRGPRAGANGVEAPARLTTDRPARATKSPAAIGATTTPAKPKPRPSTTAPAKHNRATTAPRRTERLRQPAQPGGTPPSPRIRRPVPATGADMVGTAVQAAAELAEIGLSMSARALRNAVARLPRP